MKYSRKNRSFRKNNGGGWWDDLKVKAQGATSGITGSTSGRTGAAEAEIGPRHLRHRNPWHPPRAENGLEILSVLGKRRASASKVAADKLFHV